MIAAIHQPNYLPWLGYFHKILRSDVFILLDNVQYTKDSYINRTKIKSATGPLWLTVPVLCKGRHGQAINEVEINSQTTWWVKQPKTIELAYRRSPEFARFWPSLRELFSVGWRKLAPLNISLIKRICGLLGVTTKVVLASEIPSEGGGTNRLIGLCKAVGADVYLSGSGGRKYQDEETFSLAGIELRYADFIHPRYAQLWGDFAEGLSVIDLLLNCGKQSRKILESSAEGPASLAADLSGT